MHTLPEDGRRRASQSRITPGPWIVGVAQAKKHPSPVNDGGLGRTVTGTGTETNLEV